MKIAKSFGVCALSCLFLAFSLAGCGGSGGGSNGGDDVKDDDGLTTYVNFDSDSLEYGTYMYSAGTAMTTPAATVTTSIVADPTNEDNNVLSLSGDLQNDKYASSGSYTLEIGYRIKLADLLDADGADNDLSVLLNKAFRLKVYVPADAKNTSFQVNLQDSGYQQAMGGAVSVTAGEWTTLYWKLLPGGNADNTKYTNKPCFTVLDETGAVVAQGAYTGDTFDYTKITQIELRTLAGSTYNTADYVGTAVTVLVDDIGWGDLGVATVDAAVPTISTQPVGTNYDGAPVDGTTYTLSVAATTTDAGTLSYQWYKNSVAIDGATSTTYAAAVGTEGSDTYYVIVTNTNSAVTGVKTQSVKSSVVEVSVTTVTITSGSEVVEGNSITLVATVVPESLADTLVWSVEDGTGSATLTDGVLTADTAGTVTVTATVGSVTDSQEITITAATSTTRTISFDANGGSGSMSALSGEEGDVVTLTTNSLTYIAHPFLGWNTDKTAALAGTVEYADGASITLGSGDITLYAVWQVYLLINSTAYTAQYAGAMYTIPETLNATNTYASVKLKVVLYDSTGTLVTGWTLAQLVILDDSATDWSTGKITTGYNVTASNYDATTHVWTLDISALTSTSIPKRLVLQTSAATASPYSPAYIGLISYEFVSK